LAEWYYVGHYGQLGPLTFEDMESLVRDEVIMPETMVWKPGMANWLPAGQTPELAAKFVQPSPLTPPAFPPAFPGATPPPITTETSVYSSTCIASSGPLPVTGGGFHPAYSHGRSDRSRMLAGILQIIIPGVGRMYLGYSAIGVLQLILALCGVGAIWSFIDGIIILAGGLKLDGYGRTLD
jgi:hypothetical protein